MPGRPSRPIGGRGGRSPSTLVVEVAAARGRGPAAHALAGARTGCCRGAARRAAGRARCRRGGRCRVVAAGASGSAGGASGSGPRRRAAGVSTTAGRLGGRGGGGRGGLLGRRPSWPEPWARAPRPGPRPARRGRLGGEQRVAVLLLELHLDGELDRRGRGLDELAHRLQLLENFLALDAVGLGELVNSGLGHVSPCWPQTRLRGVVCSETVSGGANSSGSTHRVLMSCCSSSLVGHSVCRCGAARGEVLLHRCRWRARSRLRGAGPGRRLSAAPRGRSTRSWGAGAPRGRVRWPSGSGTTAGWPCASEPAVTRNNSRLAARSRHPMQVRTGPARGMLVRARRGPTVRSPPRVNTTATAPVPEPGARRPRLGAWTTRRSWTTSRAGPRSRRSGSRTTCRPGRRARRPRRAYRVDADGADPRHSRRPPGVVPGRPHATPLRVSGIQSGSWSGPVGSTPRAAALPRRPDRPRGAGALRGLAAQRRPGRDLGADGRSRPARWPRCS